MQRCGGQLSFAVVCAASMCVGAGAGAKPGARRLSRLSPVSEGCCAFQTATARVVVGGRSCRREDGRRFGVKFDR